MRSCRHHWIRNFASALMALAVIAFVQQGAITAVSQAAAATGLLPDPAVTLSGQVHYHGDLARHVHAHNGEQAGHVHDPLDADSDNADPRVHPSVCSLGIVSAVIPVGMACPVVSSSASRIVLAPHDPLIGAESQRLSRPPSTPSIA